MSDWDDEALEELASYACKQLAMRLARAFNKEVTV